MGKSLIIKGADFSENAIRVPVKTLPWDPEVYWNEVQEPIISNRDTLTNGASSYNMFSLKYDKYLSYYKDKKLIGIRAYTNAGRIYFRLRKINVNVTTYYDEVITIDTIVTSKGWNDIMFDRIFDTTGNYFLAIEIDSQITTNLYWVSANDGAFPEGTTESEKESFRTGVNDVNKSYPLSGRQSYLSILYGFYTLE